MDQPTGGTDDGRAVSPVIGVVLMVAITVVLAMVAATVLHDVVTAAEVDAPAGAAVDVDDGDGVTVVWVSNTRAEKLRVEFASDGNQTVLFLRRVGGSVTLSPDGVDTTGGGVVQGGDLDVDHGDEVTVTVTAQSGDVRTQVVQRTATV